MPPTFSEAVVVKRAVPGPALYARTAMPTEAPLAMVGILHGFADHGGRYTHVMEALAKLGIGSVALDMRGHGRAAGARGACERFEEYLDDAAELAALVRDRAPGVPCFLLGHSFGGLVSTLSVMDNPTFWRGLILSSPYFALTVRPPAIKLAASRVASVVWPNLALPSGLRGKDVTHDPSRVRAYDDDPLVFKTVRARWFEETRKAQDYVRLHVSSLQTPLYMLCGGADPIASVTMSLSMYEAAGSSDKTWDERPSLFHECFSEPSWEAILHIVADWVAVRSG